MDMKKYIQPSIAIWPLQPQEKMLQDSGGPGAGDVNTPGFSPSKSRRNHVWEEEDKAWLQE